MENSERDGNSRPPYLSPEKPDKDKKPMLESDMKQWTGSKLGKEYVKPVYCHPCLFNFYAECMVVCSFTSGVSDSLRPHGL